MDIDGNSDNSETMDTSKNDENIPLVRRNSYPESCPEDTADSNSVQTSVSEYQNLPSFSSDSGIQSGENGSGYQSNPNALHRTTFVEIPLFLYLFVYKAMMPLKEQFLFAFTCHKLADAMQDSVNTSLVENPMVEAILQAPPSERNAEWQSSGQSLASMALGYMNLLQDIPGLVMTVLICSLTDVQGRRIGLILPCLGGAVKAFFFVIAIQFDLSIGVLYLAETLEGLGGSVMTAQNVALVYLSDIVQKEDKTLRFAVLQALYFLGTAFGNIAIGYMIDGWGYKYSFVAMTVIYVVDIIIILVFLQESNLSAHTKTFNVKKVFIDAVTAFRVLTTRTDQDIEEITDRANKNDEEVTNEESPLEISWQFKDTDDKWRRTILILMMFAYFCDNFSLQGRNDVDVLYMLAPPFSWSSVTIGFFQAVKYIFKAFVALLLIRLFQYCMSDAWIGLLAVASGVFANIVMAFAFNSGMLWNVTWLSSISLISPVASSLMSRYVPSHQQSALFACLGIVEGIADLVSATILDLVYSATVRVFSGAVFIIISGAYFLAGIPFIVYIISRKYHQQEPPTKYQLM